MTDAEHKTLAYTLNRCGGKVVISGYVCDLMNDLYKGWKRALAPEKMCHSVKKEPHGSGVVFNRWRSISISQMRPQYSRMHLHAFNPIFWRERHRQLKNP